MHICCLYYISVNFLSKYLKKTKSTKITYPSQSSKYVAEQIDGIKLNPNEEHGYIVCHHSKGSARLS